MTDEVRRADIVKHQFLITAFQGLVCNCPTSGFSCISPICRNIQRLLEYDSVSLVEKNTRGLPNSSFRGRFQASCRHEDRSTVYHCREWDFGLGSGVFEY